MRKNQESVRAETLAAGKISALKFQARDEERVNVYLDGHFAFGLEATRAARLRVGQHLAAPEIAALRAEDEIALAKRRAIRFLSHRPRSSAELRRHLKKRPLASETIDIVMAQLREQGYLDDAAFARFWAENRATFRPISRRALAYELSQKGLARAIIDATLDEWEDGQAALAALRANSRRWLRLPEEVRSQKLRAFLQRRGFHYRDVEEALQQFREEFATTDEHRHDHSPQPIRANRRRNVRKE